MKLLTQTVLFQTLWFVCLFAGGVWAVIATATYLYVHSRYFMRTQKEWLLLVVFGVLGVLVDGTWFSLGVLSVDTPMSFVLPLWLLCLWICTATLFAHSLLFLRGRYWLSALLALFGPTLSYFSGAKIADVIIADPMLLSLSGIALIWAGLLPFGLWLSDALSLYEERDALPKKVQQEQPY